MEGTEYLTILLLWFCIVSPFRRWRALSFVSTRMPEVVPWPQHRIDAGSEISRSDKSLFSSLSGNPCTMGRSAYMYIRIYEPPSESKKALILAAPSPHSSTRYWYFLSLTAFDQSGETNSAFKSQDVTQFQSSAIAFSIITATVPRIRPSSSSFCANEAMKVVFSKSFP